jgi:CelD/BcsL family acetyltransferase involved in cellulose biosynthesis
MISVEVLPSTFPFERLEADWSRLYDGGRWEPSVSYGWVRALLANHLAGRSNWFTVLVKRSSVVAGIVPMVLSERRLMGRRITTLEPVQEKNNTHSDLLIADHDPALLAAWLQALTDYRPAWDLLKISRLLEEGPLNTALAEPIRACGRAFRLKQQQPSYYLPLPPSYDDYLRARTGKFRSHLKRAEKKLASAGQQDFVVARGENGIEAAFGDLIEIEKDSWKHANGTAISSVTHQSGFYRDLVESASKAGNLHLTFLRLDGKAVAYNLGIIENGCYYYLKTSFRSAYAPLQVATVGRAWLIRQLIAEGLAHLDFPAEPYEWERQWTGDLRWHRSLMLFNCTANAAVMRVVLRARELLRGSPGPREVVHSEARALKGDLHADPKGEDH